MCISMCWSVGDYISVNVFVCECICEAESQSMDIVCELVCTHVGMGMYMCYSLLSMHL